MSGLFNSDNLINIYALKKRKKHHADDYIQYTGNQYIVSMAFAAAAADCGMENYRTEARDKKVCDDSRASYFKLGFLLRPFNESLF